MTCTKRLLALILVGGLAACNEPTRPAMTPRLPQFSISDGAHEGGTPGFFFLPPVVAQPAVSGSFDADITTLNPQIAICDITDGPDNNCGGPGGTSALAVFTTTSTPAISVDLTAPQYQVNWDTKAAGFVAGSTYRLHVMAGSSGSRRELGFADVLLTSTPGQAKNLATGELITMKDGKPLPIHFRIETGIPGSVTVAAATPSVATGGTDLLTSSVQDLHGEPVAGAVVAWTVTAASDVVGSLVPTSGLTNGVGQATTLFTAGTKPGTAAVAATSAGVSATATVMVTAPTPDKPLFVSNQNGLSITAYAPGASGNATPITTIAEGNTGLGAPSGIGLDGAGNVYVAHGGSNSITVYAAGASGNAPPMTTIAGGNTRLSVPFGIALDAAGNIYVANGGSNSITVYAAGASGNASPITTIAGGNTGLNVPFGIALDGAGNIYVADLGNNSITVYAAGASGNATPMATIAGANTGLFGPLCIALDGARNIYVTIATGSTIAVFAAGANGNATPMSTIAGPNTGLFGQLGIALDGAGKIYVANFAGNNITVYAAGASGDATPTATIGGANTGLNAPRFITF